MLQLLFPLIFLGLMWVLLVRPQQQRVRQQRELIAALRVGDDVVTAGGIFGRIVALTDDEATLEVAPGVELRFLRAAMSTRLGEIPDPDPSAPELPEGSEEGPR